MSAPKIDRKVYLRAAQAVDAKHDWACKMICQAKTPPTWHASWDHCAEERLFQELFCPADVARDFNYFGPRVDNPAGHAQRVLALLLCYQIAR